MVNRHFITESLLDDSNWEILGKLCFKYALTQLKNGNSELFYEYIKIGYNFVTCDCKNDWLNDEEELHNDYENLSDIDNWSIIKEDIIKLFVYTHSNYKLDAVVHWERNMPWRTDDSESESLTELRYYLVGKAYGNESEFQDNEKALEYFQKALNIKRTPRSLYWIGMLNERLKNSGVKYLYEATCNNVSSWCSCRKLKVHSEKLNLKLKEYDSETPSNAIIKQAFNKPDNEIAFCKILLNLLLTGRYKFENEVMFCKSSMTVFLNQLISSKEIFTPEYINYSLINYHDIFNTHRDKIEEAVLNNNKEPKEIEELPKLISQSKSQPYYRENWLEFQNIIDRYNIKKLYHFTDKSNLASIISNGALFSWSYCDLNNILITVPGGNSLSRELDMNKGVENYVRLSFSYNHPMMYVPPSRARNCVILEINPEVILFRNSKFADKNATRNDVEIGDSIEYFKKIKFEIATLPNHLNLSAEDKPYYQSEVLVYEKVLAEYILNLGSIAGSSKNDNLLF